MDKRAAAISLPVTAVIMTVMIYMAVTLPEDPRQVLQPQPEISGTVPVGVMLSLTGDLAGQGNDQLLAIQLAASDFNEYLQDQQADWQIDLVVEDTGADPATALNRTQSLHSSGISLIVGPQSSAELHGIDEYVNTNGLLVISPSSKEPSLARDDNIFRFVPDDEKSSAAIAKLLERRGVEVAIPVYRGDIWGDGLSQATRNSFEALGGTVDQGIRYLEEAPAFSDDTRALADIVEGYLDQYEQHEIAVLLFGFSEAASFFDSASEYPVLRAVQWVGAEAATNDRRIEENLQRSTFASEVGFTAPVFSVSDNDLNTYVRESVTAMAGDLPHSTAYSAYDAVWVLGLSMLQSGSAEPADVRQVLTQVAFGHTGAIGQVRLNEAGDLDSSDYDLWRVVDDSWRIDEHYAASMDRVIPITYAGDADGVIDVPEVVRVGTLISLTGDLAGQGNDQLLAIQLATSDFNEYLQDQQAGWQMDLVVEDTGADPATALDRIRSLHSSGISLVVGPQSSAELHGISEYVNTNGLLVISPSSKEPSLARDDNIFRFVPDDKKSSAAIAKLLDQRGVKVAIPVYRGDIWGDGLSEATRDAFMELGGIVHEGIRYPLDIDIFPVESEALSVVVRQYSEEYERDEIAVLLFGFSEVAGFLNSASHYLNLRTVQWVGAEASTNDQSIEENLQRSTFASDVGFTAPVFSVSENQANQRVRDHVLEVVGDLPHNSAYSAYDAIWVLGLSILNTGSVDAEALRDALPATSFSYTGAIGQVRLNLAGDLDVSDYELWSVRGDSWDRYGYYAASLDEVIVQAPAG